MPAPALSVCSVAFASSKAASQSAASRFAKSAQKTFRCKMQCARCDFAPSGSFEDDPTKAFVHTSGRPGSFDFFAGSCRHAPLTDLLQAMCCSLGFSRFG